MLPLGKRDLMWRTGDPVPKGYVVASDGLPARSQGVWAQDKLRFLEEYLPPAIGATKKKGGHTHYVDLYAGPGRNATVGRDGRPVDFPGSPIIALRSSFYFDTAVRPTHFGHFHFCNMDPFSDFLLRVRVERTLADLGGSVKPERVRFYRGDSNLRVHDVLESIPSYAYLLVFADIEGPEDIHFSTIEALKRRHSSVDLYILYPTNIGLGRLLTYRPDLREKYRPLLTRFFGTEEWWDIVSDRKTGRQSAVMRQRLLHLYIRQLKTLWGEAEVVREVRKARRGLYHMIFAHDHPAAGSIAKSARRRSDQYGLLDGL